MALTKQQILEKFTQRRYAEVGGIRLQSLTELEQSKLQTLWGNRWNQTKEVDPVMRRELVALCIVDGSGQRCFSNEDIELMAELDGGIVERLYDKCRELCGMDGEVVDSGTLGKDTSETTDSD